MKIRFLLLLALITYSCVSFAQITVDVYLNAEEKIDRSNYVKNSTLIIPIPSLTASTYNDYKKVFSETWTFCPIKFIQISDTSIYKRKPKFCFFEPKVIETVKSDQKGFVERNTYYLFSLNYLREYPRKGKVISYEYDFIQLALYPTFKVLAVNERFDSHIFEFGKDFYNWSPGFLKNYLQIIQKELETFYINSTIKKASPQIKQLQKDTLFIPEYILIKFNPFNGNEDKRHDVKDLLRDYPYPYKVISMEALSKKILTGQGSLFYLHFIKDSSSTYVNVIDGRTGEILFTIEDYYYAYNIKEKDIKKIAKEVGGK